MRNWQGYTSVGVLVGVLIPMSAQLISIGHNLSSRIATKEDIQATKEDIQATKEDIQATMKEDIQESRQDIKLIKEEVRKAAESAEMYRVNFLDLFTRNTLDMQNRLGKVEKNDKIR